MKIYLLLRLQVRDKLFSKSGDLKIKCTAAIDTIYWRSNEESIQGLSERSYNLNIRDNGWNSGAFPEKVFLFVNSILSSPVSAAIPIRSSSPSVSLFPALLGWAFLSTRFNIIIFLSTRFNIIIIIITLFQRTCFIHLVIQPCSSVLS